MQHPSPTEVKEGVGSTESPARSSCGESSKDLEDANWGRRQRTLQNPTQ